MSQIGTGSPRNVPAPNDRNPVLPSSGIAGQIRKGGAVGQQQGRTARDIQRSQSRDERRHPQLRNQDAVDRARQRAGQQRHRNHQPGMKIDHHAK